MTKYAIEVCDVKKSFLLPRHKSDSLKAAITQVFKPKDTNVDTFKALDGISFKVEKGDFFGILGRNGSGKSTLLKIISEIYKPSSGHVKHDGKIVSFIELGVGFKPELSGRENVFLNGALLGFSKYEIENMYEDIVSFAELEQFMDQKLKNYSSGMKVRLAFSVAIRAKADILILDEVLAVGDAAFQKKCNNYFETLKGNKRTVILVTHSMTAVKRFCTRAVLIEEGRVKCIGDAGVVSDEYSKLFVDSAQKKLPNADEYREVDFENVELNTQYRENFITFDLSLTPKSEVIKPVIAILIYKGNNQVYRWVSDESPQARVVLRSGSKFAASLKVQNIFPVGKYSVSLMIRREDRKVDYGIYENISNFQVINHTEYQHNVLWRPESEFSLHGDSGA
jgi:ABC-2 type transport system ATP-binding protein